MKANLKIEKVNYKNTQIACISDSWSYEEAIRRIKCGAFNNNLDISCFLQNVKRCSILKLMKLCKQHNINVY